MATCHLLKLPFEILIMVFENCDDLIQVASLASTCKLTNSVWKSSESSIIRSVGFRCIPAFDEALVAARATEIVKAAILSRRLPPKDINVADLSPAVRPPTAADMAAGMDMQYLANFVERYYLRGLALNRIYHWDVRGPDVPRPDEWALSCRVYFHRAVYRVLLAGPVLAGSYLEPFAYEGVLYPQMRTAPDGSEPMFPPDMPTQMRADDWHNDEREDDVVEYLSSPHRELDLGGFCGGSPEQEIAMLREVILMLVAYEILSAAITNLEGNERHGRVGEYIRYYGDGREATAIIEPDEARTVFAVIMGVYQLETLHVSHTDRWPTERLIATPARYPAEDSLRLRREADVFETLQFIHVLSGRINHIDGSATPPPQFQLFTFILDRFFGMQFEEGYFRRDEGYTDFFGIVFNGSLFTNALTVPNHANPCKILDNRSQSPIYTFDQVW
ncbi:hypothetical protein GE09DRAFT_1284693 [Coniochaeta sp. 2T2.1]|nr:hypothetical protein GE09DRAFT_1284693 [Coniochaeta sp. 2T2.1]